MAVLARDWGDLLTLRFMTDELALFFFLAYAACALSGYAYAFLQIALFNRSMLRGVRLTFRCLRKRFPELGEFGHGLRSHDRVGRTHSVHAYGAHALIYAVA